MDRIESFQIVIDPDVVWAIVIVNVSKEEQNYPDFFVNAARAIKDVTKEEPK